MCRKLSDMKIFLKSVIWENIGNLFSCNRHRAMLENYTYLFATRYAVQRVLQCFSRVPSLILSQKDQNFVCSMVCIDSLLATDMSCFYFHSCFWYLYSHHRCNSQTIRKFFKADLTIQIDIYVIWAQNKIVRETSSTATVLCSILILASRIRKQFWDSTWNYKQHGLDNCSFDIDCNITHAAHRLYSLQSRRSFDIK